MKKLLSICTFSILCTTTFGQYELGWNAQVSGSLHDDSRGMILSNNGLYACGRIESTANFISGTTFSTETSAGQDDIFLSKMDTDGNYQWVKSMGGTGNEQAVAINADAQGNIYIVGFFSSTFDFDPGAGTASLNPIGETDAFVAKFSAAGDLIWVNPIQGALTERVEGIAMVSDGVVVTGRFDGSIETDPGAGSSILTSVGGVDIFVVKYDLNGNHVWSNSYGAGNGDIGWGIDSDASDNIYVTGVFKNTIEFESGNASSMHTSLGMSDGFILKLNSAGAYQWSKVFGSSSDDTSKGVTVGPSNAIYVTGFYEGTVDFNPGAGISNETSNGNGDAFLLKLNASGDFQWVNSLGGIEDGDKGKYVTFDADDNIFYAGLYTGTISIGGTNYSSNGLVDVFVQKLDQSGTVLWSTAFGTANEDFINAVLVDSDTSLYIDGKFNGSMDSDPSVNLATVTSVGDYDGYIFKWSLEQSLGIEEKEIGSKTLLKIVDLMGRETKLVFNTPLIYYYSDGSIEKVFKLEE